MGKKKIRIKETPLIQERRSKISKISMEIRDYEILLERTKKTFNNMKKGETIEIFGNKIIHDTIQKCDIQIKEYAEKLNELKSLQSMYARGEFDENIQQELDDVKEKHLRQLEAQKLAACQKIEEEKQQRELIKKQELDKIISSVPDFILDSIGSMPRNKGYIWRGYRIFGHGKMQNGRPILLIEPKKGFSIQHKWDGLEYTQTKNEKKIYTVIHRKQCEAEFDFEFKVLKI